MARPWASDLIGVLRGAQTVANALLKHQEDSIKKVLDNSSIKVLAEANIKEAGKKLSEIDPSKVPVSYARETISENGKMAEENGGFPNLLL